MTTLTNKHIHTPHMDSISTTNNGMLVEYTFCEDCEQNIERFFIDDDYDRLPFWSSWCISK